MIYENILWGGIYERALGLYRIFKAVYDDIIGDGSFNIFDSYNL